jgi:hypothetical protein
MRYKADVATVNNYLLRFFFCYQIQNIKGKWLIGHISTGTTIYLIYYANGLIYHKIVLILLIFNAFIYRNIRNLSFYFISNEIKKIIRLWPLHCK